MRISFMIMIVCLSAILMGCGANETHPVTPAEIEQARAKLIELELRRDAQEQAKNPIPVTSKPVIESAGIVDQFKSYVCKP